MQPLFSVAVEGMVDEAVARKLLAQVRAGCGRIFERGGKDRLRKGIDGFNNAAKREPWLVLVDLDRDFDCAPPLRKRWLPNPAPYMCFRIAVRQVEAWLLADRGNLAKFLGVPPEKLPSQPESLDDPKGEMVALARRSRQGKIRKGMVPRQGSGRPVGELYTTLVIRFVRDHWDPAAAARRAPSLRRAIGCLRRLARTMAVGETKV